VGGLIDYEFLDKVIKKYILFIFALKNKSLIKALMDYDFLDKAFLI